MSGHRHLDNVQMSVSHIYKLSYLQSVTHLCFINTVALFYLTILAVTSHRLTSLIQPRDALNNMSIRCQQKPRPASTVFKRHVDCSTYRDLYAVAIRVVT